jgi:hypothetical protein
MPIKGRDLERALRRAGRMAENAEQRSGEPSKHIRDPEGASPHEILMARLWRLAGTPPGPGASFAHRLAWQMFRPRSTRLQEPAQPGRFDAEPGLGFIAGLDPQDQALIMWAFLSLASPTPASYSSSRSTGALAMLARVVVAIALLLLPAAAFAQAEKRMALLIGNQAYGNEIGRLANPHNDVALLEKTLRSIGFEVTTVRDAGLGGLHQAVNAYARRVQAAGPNAVGFFYYSGHGAADSGVNYLIPVDVKTTDTGDLWDQSLRLTEITRKLKVEAGNASHFVVFDACRNSLKLTRPGTRSLIQSKGFVPVAQESGMLIAYATAEGELAFDVGAEAGPYAKTLAEELVKPGVEAVTMFRNVQLRVKQTIGQDPWLSFPSLPAVYFAGTKPTENVELTFWEAVKDSTSVPVLNIYLQRYPNGEFASTARALIERYERQLKAEQAAREEERRRQEEVRKLAELKRLEEERLAREATLSQERQRAEQIKDLAEVKRVEEQQRAEIVARTEELRKAQDAVQVAREATKAAEDRKLAAVKAAEEAKKDAQQPKLAALSKEDTTKLHPFDGVWTIVRDGPGCPTRPHVTFTLTVKGSRAYGKTSVVGPGGDIPLYGAVASSGSISFSHGGLSGGRVSYSGVLRSKSGSGTFAYPGTPCSGTFTAQRR